MLNIHDKYMVHIISTYPNLHDKYMAHMMNTLPQILAQIKGLFDIFIKYYSS